jgi:hypothetical protein
LDDGVAPVINDGEEVADAVQKGMASSMTWSAPSAAFCDDGEMRLDVLHGVGRFGW